MNLIYLYVEMLELKHQENDRAKKQAAMEYANHHYPDYRRNRNSCVLVKNIDTKSLSFNDQIIRPGEYVVMMSSAANTITGMLNIKVEISRL